MWAIRPGDIQMFRKAVVLTLLVLVTSTSAVFAAQKELAPYTVLISSDAEFRWDYWTMPNLEGLLQQGRLVRMCKTVDGKPLECEYVVPAPPRPKTTTFYSDRPWSVQNWTDEWTVHPSKQYIENENLAGWTVRVCSTQFGKSATQSPRCQLFPPK